MGPWITGAKVSNILILWLAELEFPHVSVKVQVRTKEKLLGQPPGVTWVLGRAIITPSQLSMAVKFSGGGKSKTQSRFKSGGMGPWITGGKVSNTLIIWFTELVFPHVSVKVQVRTKEKLLRQVPGVYWVLGRAIITPSQLSMAVKFSGGGNSEAH